MMNPRHTRGLCRDVLVPLLTGVLLVAPLPVPQVAHAESPQPASFAPVAELGDTSRISRVRETPPPAARTIDAGAPALGPASPLPPSSLLRPKDAAGPQPGIRKTAPRTAGMRLRQVRPPQPPGDLVKYFPNEYAAPGAQPAKAEEDGRLQRLIRPDGGIVDYEYDRSGQLLRVRYPDGTEVSYTYDDGGRRTSMTDGQGTTVYRYDADGRLEAVYQPGFDPLRYRYDADGRLAGITYPNGRAVSYGYDHEDRLLAVTGDAGTTRYEYHPASGRLLGQTLPNGLEIAYGYDADGRLVEVLHRNPAAEVVLGFSTTLDERGQPTAVHRETPEGVETTVLDYDADGRLALVVHPDGRTMSYSYDEAGNRTRMSVTAGAEVAVTDYFYDLRGRLIQAGDESFEYDRNGNLALRWSPQRTIEYGYDAEDRLVGYRDGDHEVQFAYDGDGRRVAMTVDGLERRYGHDASGFLGEVLCSAAAGEPLRTYTYGLERIAFAGADGEQGFFLYERPLRHVAAWADAAGTIAARFAYDPFGVPLAARGESPFEARARDFSSDQGAKPEEYREYFEDFATQSWRKRPAVGRKDFYHGLLGPPADPAFLFAAAPYDAATGLIYLDGRYYDPALGRFLTPPASEEDAADGYWRNHPLAHRALPGAFADQLATALGLGGASATPEPEADADSPEPAPTEVVILQSNQLPPAGLEAKGRRGSKPFPKLSQFERGSTRRRPVIRKQPAPAQLKLHPETLQFAQTATGLLAASQTLEIGSTTAESISFTLSEDIPWLALSASGGVAGADPLVITATVDTAGLTSAGNPYLGDVVVTHTGDPQDVRRVRVRLTSSDAASAPTLRSYNANGALQRLVKPDGNDIDYDYDAIGRLVQIRYPDGGSVEYQYDANGNRISMTDARGVTIYQYDEQNRVTAVFHPGLNPIRYAYDDADNLTSLTYPDGRVVNYEYDGDDRLIGITDGADTTSYAYDPVSGRLDLRTLPNGMTTEYAHDSAGRLSGVVHKDAGGSLLAAFYYTYDGNGLRTSMTRQTPSGSETTSYEYDALQRLERVLYPGGREVSYTYDALGNRLSMNVLDPGGDETVAYTFDNENRLMTAGSEVFQHDVNGNMIRRVGPDGTTEYAYDYENRLIEVDRNGQVVGFEYDGDGNRVAEVAGGTRINYVNEVNSPYSQVLIEADGNWSVKRSYVYGFERISVDAAQTGEEFYIYDGILGNAAYLVNHPGAATAEMTYDAFGTPTGMPAGGSGHFLFTGERYDSQTGLIFLRKRYYDPQLGRFIARDPALGYSSNPQTRNPYPYAQNNPINMLDPLGLAHIPKRPLDGSPFGFNYGNSYLDQQNLELLHEHVVFDEPQWIRIGGEMRLVDNVGFGSDGLFTENISNFSYERSGGHFDDAAVARTINQLDAAGTFSGDNYRWYNHNCQDWSEAVRTGSGDSSFSGFNNPYTGTLYRDDDYYFIDPLGPGGGFSPYGSSIFDDYTTYNPFDLGGVSLNKTADLLLEIDDLTGATYDEATGQLILLGQEDVALPAMELDDLAVAVDSVFTGRDPGVSIDPPIVNNQMSVRYEGETSETEFGWIMFEADRVLKILSLGKDNLTGLPVSSAVPGYQSMLARRLAAGCTSVPDSTRMWFQPKEVRLVRSEDGRTMVFDEVSMELLYESKVGDQVVSDPHAAAFASHFTANYDAFAQEWPILRELERLGKIVAVMKWIKDNNIPIDLSFIDNYAIEYFSTPIATPVVTVQGSISGGGMICTITLQGGVTYRPPNEYLSDDPVDPITDAVRDEALGNRPSENDFLWSFQPSSRTARRLKGVTADPLTAVAQSFTRSRKDGNIRFREVDLSYPAPGARRLELVRTYDSFGDRSGPFGPGWHVFAWELRFPVAKEAFTFGPDNLAFDLHARIWLADRPGGREDVFELIGIDDADLPLYLRSGAMDLMRQQGDGSFLLTRVDGTELTFDAAGRPLVLTDANANTLSFGYTAGRLDRLEAPDGRAITLTYNGNGRIMQAAGPGGGLITYGYDGQGNLTAVAEAGRQTRSYSYDADLRLGTATDAEGNPLFDAGYDDYGRTPDRRLGSAADFDYAYDLGERRTAVTDPHGELTEQHFDAQYRLSAQTDPLGNRFTIGYDGDFGPALITDAEGASTELGYDPRGNLIDVIDAAGGETELFYDYRDRLVAVRDPEGIETAFGYDDRNNLTAIYHTVVLQQDEYGDLVSFLYDPDHVTTFTYAADGGLEAVTDPLDRSGQFAYDASGQLDLATSPSGRVTDYDYDARSRLTAVSGGGTQLDLGYDGADNLTAVTTAAGSAGFAYADDGRLTRITDALSQATDFQYDADGNLTALVDAARQTTDYDYDVLGRLTAVHLPNGSAKGYAYDALGRPVVTFAGLGSADPRLGMTVDALAFGAVGVGGEATREIALYNLSRVPLTISGAGADPPFAGDLSAPAVIAPGDFLTVTVSFAPTAVGPASGQLTVTSDDPDQPVRLVSLSGEGVLQVIHLEATATSGGIHLSWDPFDPHGEPFVHFNIYRSTEPIPGDVAGLVPIDETLTDAAETSFDDYDAAPGQGYYYAVTPEFTGTAEYTAVDPAGPVAFFTSFGPVAPQVPIAQASSDELRPAVVYNATAGEYLAVYELDAAGDGSNLDVVGQRLAADGSPVGSAFAIAADARHERRPRVAWNSSGNQYLVVYELDYQGDGSDFDIAGQLVDASGTLPAAAFWIGGFTVHEWAPEVVYNPTAGEYFVVFEYDYNGDGSDLDVVGQRVSAAGAPLGDTFFVGGILSGGISVHDRNPHLAYNGTDDQYLVVFEVDVNADGSNYDVFGTRWNADGTQVGSVFYVAATAVGGVPVDDQNPYVAYDGTHNEYLVVWELDFFGDGSDIDVHSQKLAADGSPTGLESGFLQIAASTAHERHPRQVYNPAADEHLIVWDVAGGDCEIAARRFRVNSASLMVGGLIEVAGGSAIRQRPDIAHNGAANTFLVAWEEDVGGNFDLHGRLLGNEAPQLDVSPGTLGFGDATSELALTISNTGTGTLLWVASSDQAWLAATPDGGSTTGSTATQVTVSRTGLAPGGYAGTLTVSSNGGDVDVPVTMTVDNSPPQAPHTPVPADGSGSERAGDGSLDLTLGWQSGDGDGDPVTYDLYFATDGVLVTAEDPGVRVAQGLTGTSFATSGLEFLTTYSWRAVAFDDHGASTSGPTWSFTTAALAAPQLVAELPDPTRNPRPTLDWEAVAGAARYHLQIAGSAAFSAPLVDDDTLTATSFTPAAALPEGPIHWRVRTIDAGAQPGPFSAAGVFAVDLTPPAVPVLVAVAPDPTKEARPTLTWNPVSGAASYRVQAAQEAGFAAPLLDLTAAATSHVPAAALPEGAIHWRVASLDPAGNESAFAAASSFAIDLTSPAAVTGPAAARDVAGDVVLSWDPLSGPPADFAHFNVYRSTQPFSNVSGMGPIDASITNPAVTGHTDASAGPVTAYYYAVTAVDAVGNENKSVTAAFVPGNRAPNAPQDPLPADGAVDQSGSAFDLSWQASDPEGDAIRYDLYLSTQLSQVTALDLGARVAQDLAAATFHVEDLLYLSTWYWRVVAVDAPGGATAGPVWSFTTAAIPAPVLVALAPDPTDDAQPIFGWQPVPGAVRYRIEIDDEATFASPLLSDDNVTATTFTPASALPEGTLHWRVRAIDVEDRAGSFSAPDTFVIDLSLAANRIFTDGFESGDLSAWSQAVGGS